MIMVDGSCGVAIEQALHSVLADRFEHREAWFAVVACMLAHQAVVDQVGNAVEHVQRRQLVLIKRYYLLGHLQRPAADKHA